MAGSHEDGDHVMTTVTKAMLTANFFFADEKAMLAMEIARTLVPRQPGEVRPHAGEREPLPRRLEEQGRDRRCRLQQAGTTKGAYGMAKLPWWGKTIIVALADGDRERRPFGLVARTLAHELGHFLGLGHGSGDGQAANIMTPSDLGLPIDKSVLWPEQIEEMQTKLARNLARQGDRHRLGRRSGRMPGRRWIGSLRSDWHRRGPESCHWVKMEDAIYSNHLACNIPRERAERPLGARRSGSLRERGDQVGAGLTSA